MESLHQMRVGLRRLRSALGMFKTLLALPQALQDELDWLTGALGEARDWDVLAGHTLAQLDGDAGAGAGPGPGPDPGALAQLTQAAQELAQEKHLLAAQAVASTRYTALMLGLQRWLHGSDWRSSRTPRQLQRLDAGVHGFAQRTLRAGQRRLMKRGKRLLHATPQQRHRVRIAAKKTRYATEFFASLLHTRKVRPYVGRLSVLQDALGAMNDVRVADRLLQELPNGQADLQWQAAFIRGYLAARAQGGEGQRRMDKAWRRLAKTALPV